jgi:hypothetical protein
MATVRKSLLGAATAALLLGSSLLGGAMRAFDNEMPAFGSRRTPTFAAPVEYDGNGNKVKPKRHPAHNANRKTREWRAYASRVTATHSFNYDERDDKYLHSAARRARAALLLAA